MDIIIPSTKQSIKLKTIYSVSPSDHIHIFSPKSILVSNLKKKISHDIGKIDVVN